MPKRYKISVYGSAVNESLATHKKAVWIGKELTKTKSIVITGACSGVPYAAAHAAAKAGAEVWGFSSELDKPKQKQSYAKYDITIYKKLIFVPKNFPFLHNQTVRKKYRNVISTASCDAAIVISGRWGTMHEVSSLYDFGKVIGVLTTTGGIADQLKSLSGKISKPSSAKFIFNSSPKTLVKLIMQELKHRNK